MKWNWIASGSIVVMLAYFVVDNHVDLYPWNNLTTSQFPSTLAALIPFGVYATAFALGVRWLMLVGTVHSYVWLGAADSPMVDSVPVRAHCATPGFRVVFC
jgi:hypothetical protein